MKRRDMLRLSGAATLAAVNGLTSAQKTSKAGAEKEGLLGEKPLPGSLQLADFQPRSMLHTAVTSVPRSRYPVVDIHTHLTMENGLDKPGKLRVPATPEECLAVMDRKNIRTMINLTGGYGDNLKQSIDMFQNAHPGRFLSLTEPAYRESNQPGYPQRQADMIQQAHALGCRGLKVLKTLGLYLRENITTGPLVKIDDPRFDPMWDACGQLGMPVAIHISDPQAFFLPIDRFNERWEELHAHPSWSFYGKDFPSDMALQESRRRVMRRHPKTTFICLHMADAEDLPYVTECMEAHPNMYVELAARIGELGRQPRASRRFIERYADRTLFGTDAIPKSYDVPQQIFNDELYEIYYRFLETEDEYFDYAPAPTPPQGRWRISGLGLDDATLRKVYWSNAARLFGLTEA